MQQRRQSLSLSLSLSLTHTHTEGLSLKAAKHVNQQASPITQNDIESDTTCVCVCDSQRATSDN